LVESLNTFAPKLGGVLPINVTDVKLALLLNASLRIVWTLAGIVISVSPVFANATKPILTRPSGSVALISLGQFTNAADSISLTFSPTTTDLTNTEPVPPVLLFKPSPLTHQSIVPLFVVTVRVPVLSSKDQPSPLKDSGASRLVKSLYLLNCETAL
jgi:hypothetical protein